jgi:hypothetical protein
MRASQPFTHRNTNTYHWRTNSSRWELVTAGRVVAKVVPDAVYAGMWRIDLGDGALSDMVNLTRAKEAAVMRADAIIRKRHLGASSIRQNDLALTKEHGTSAPALEASVVAEFGTQYEPALL